MFIELTVHLRCPADHPESFLVLVPEEMHGRVVNRGTLGCPACGREYPIRGAALYFTPEPQPVAPPAEGRVDAGAIAAFLGIQGPGGYVGLVGSAVGLAEGLEALWPGVHLVAVNPPAQSRSSERLSAVFSPRLPFKSRSLRGIVLGKPFGAMAGWPEGAIQCLLPGLRAAGEGPAPTSPGFALLGEAENWWVGKRET
jgi:uncharacterized protein YbaR (Trm112 family)